MGELHRRFGSALAELADTAGVIRALDESDSRPAWWPGDMLWKQTYGSFTPDQPAYATLAFESAAFESAAQPSVIVLVKAYRETPEAAGPGAWLQVMPEAGVLHVRSFPDDPRLPTLAAVVRAYEPVHVVRYRPEKRCTLRIGTGEQTSWAKVFPDLSGEALHGSQVALWEAAARGELDVAVAPPLRFDAAERAVWIGHVPGAGITGALFGADGPELAERLGRAAGSVTQISVAPQTRVDSAMQMERTRRNAATIAGHIPELAVPLEEVIGGLERLHGRATSRPRPIHGAPHPEQWLDDGGRLGLIDFDRFSLSDPELDITTFQAEVDFEGLPGALRDDINDAFRFGYESVAGSMDPSLLVAYRVHKRFAKVGRAARAIRPDGDLRAAHHLARVTELLLASGL